MKKSSRYFHGFTNIIDILLHAIWFIFLSAALFVSLFLRSFDRSSSVSSGRRATLYIWYICQVSLQGEFKHNYTPHWSSLYNYTVVDTNINRAFNSWLVICMYRGCTSRNSFPWSAVGGYILCSPCVLIVERQNDQDFHFIVALAGAYNEVTLNRWMQHKPSLCCIVLLDLINHESAAFNTRISSINNVDT